MTIYTGFPLYNLPFLSPFQPCNNRTIDIIFHLYTCFLILFYMKYFLDLLLWNRFLFRNCHFLTHLLLTTLDVLTILWTSYIVTSTKTLQNWHIQYLSFHLAPCLLSLTKIENLSKIWKWNAKAKKHKCVGFLHFVLHWTKPLKFSIGLIELSDSK